MVLESQRVLTTFDLGEVHPREDFEKVSIILEVRWKGISGRGNPT